MEFKTLNDLFAQWKQAHANESDFSCKSTFPKKDGVQIPAFKSFKSSFCMDGFLSDEFNGILFILKESDTGGCAQLDDFFWFKACADKEHNGEHFQNSYWQKYRRNMEWYIENAVGKNMDFRQCAYMNLNKRGGYGKCDDKQLCAYVEEYKSFIENQIKLINPQYIFCCGVDGVSVYDIVLPIVKDSACEATIFKCRHLCFWGKRYIYNK